MGMKLKIGKVLNNTYDTGHKDAVHSPCILVRSYDVLKRADYVKFGDNSKVWVEPCEEWEACGIVDPFLTEEIGVADNVSFWVFLKPDSISNLTHNFEFNDDDDDGCKSMGCN